MEDLNRLIADNLAIATGGLALVLLFVVVGLLVQSIRLGRALGAYRTLVGGGEVGSLREVIESQFGRVDEMGRRLGEADRLHAQLEERTLRSIQHIGLVRFNPFEDTGSDQSFAIALLDAQRDGIVISSLHGRANTRLFAKPVQGGASSHTLSDEEERAIRIAIGGTGEGKPNA